MEQLPRFNYAEAIVGLAKAAMYSVEDQPLPEFQSELGE